MSEMKPTVPVFELVSTPPAASRQRELIPPTGDDFSSIFGPWRALTLETDVRRLLVSSRCARGSTHSAGDARRSSFTVVGLLLAGGKMSLLTVTVDRLMRSVG